MEVQAYLGEIRLFGFNFVPRGWAQCNGQLVQISSNTALFSLLGTMYGGDGVTTYGLPDLRGRVPIGPGQGPGLANYTQGDAAGAEEVTLTPAQLPAHQHTANAATAATTQDPTNALPATTTAPALYGTTAQVTMSPTMISGGGNGEPHSNMQPYLVANWCIAVEGVFPDRALDPQ